MTVELATCEKPLAPGSLLGPSRTPRVQDSLRRVLRDATVVVVAAALLGILSNALRPTEKLPWIQNKPYDVLVPCPEPIGQAQATEPDAPIILAPSSLLVDARAASDFALWHGPRAISAPFDWLGPPVHEDVLRVAQIVARSNAKRVVIYGDGDDPDSGREWARLLSGGGIRNVFFVEGGAPALRRVVDVKGGPLP